MLIVGVKGKSKKTEHQTLIRRKKQLEDDEKLV